jgi:uncharacterized protein YlxP (DUF503 family)
LNGLNYNEFHRGTQKELNEKNELRKSQSLSNLLHAEAHERQKRGIQTISTDDMLSVKTLEPRVSLIDKKKLKWNQDLSLYLNLLVGCFFFNLKFFIYSHIEEANDQWNPFDKEVDSRRVVKEDFNSYNLKNKLDEYSRINETVAAITAAENKIKKEILEKQQLAEQQQKAANDFYHDQSICSIN